MEIKTITNSKEIRSFIYELRYGSSYARFIDEKTRIMFIEAIVVSNVILGEKAIRAEDAIEDYTEDGVYKSREIPGVLRVTYSLINQEGPKISSDDMMIESICEMVSRNKTAYQSSLNPKLFKIAKKIASQYRIKFEGSTLLQQFDGREKKGSVLSRLEKAIFEQKDSIEFNSKEIGLATLRVYVSNVRNFSDEKIKVVVNGDKYLVRFKAPTIVDFLQQELNMILFKAKEQMDHKDVIVICRNVLDKFSEGVELNSDQKQNEVFSPVVAPVADWIKYGWESEEAFNAFVDAPLPPRSEEDERLRAEFDAAQESEEEHDALDGISGLFAQEEDF